MERSRKLTLTNWSKANTALQKHFEGNKSKLAKDRKVSRTTVTAFFKCEPVREAEFRKIAFALYLDEKDWQVSSETAIVPKQEDWIEEVRSRCCQKILYQHGTIQLLNQTEVGVDQLYVDVWVLDRSPRTFQVSESTMLRSFDLRNDRLGLGDRIKHDEGIKVANDETRLLILGKPGAGKTTFLKHLAVDCSNGKFQPNLIPLLIELRRIESTQWKLLNAISEELSLDSQQTQRLLEQGKLLILMDGLDEVPTNNFRRDVQNQVRSLAQEPKYSHNRFILTCRTQVIEAVPQGFTPVEVAEFNPKQVKKFVKNWFRASGQTEAGSTQQWQVFSDVIETNPALEELTVTPVLLSLMCWVFQDSGDLPTQAALLYQKGIRLLLEKWNEHKEIPEWEIGKQVYRELEPEQKEALLSEIAARKFENPVNFVLFEQKDLVKQIANFLDLANARDGEAVLKAIEAQHGLLVERADELWSFSHLAFQEYFVAREMINRSNYQPLLKNIADKRWREVCLLTMNMAPNVGDLLLQMKQQIDSLIVEDEELQQYLNWVMQKSVEVPYKAALVRDFYFVLAFREFIDLDTSRTDLVLTHNLAYGYGLDFNLYYALDLAYALDLINMTNPVVLDWFLARAHTRNRKLQRKLQELRDQLLEPTWGDNWDNLKDFQQWWTGNSQSWIDQLRKAMIEYRNIGHDWSFSKAQKEKLRQYYDANRLLVDYLNSDHSIDRAVRQEIEDNLFLPIATLRERLPDLYGE